MPGFKNTMNAAPMKKFSGTRLLKRVGAMVGIVAVSVGGFLAYRQLSGNFHPVIDNVVYRSSQPSAADIAYYAKTSGIRSIINLRGANPGSSWYDAEVASAKAEGIAHYDFRMSASQQLDQSRAEELIALMRNAEKPLLIHCQAGADRTGLAAALYKAAISKEGESAAEGQISFWYGHISIPHTAAYPMDQTFEALEPWLGFPDS